jgi:hypothetical protein
MGSQSFSIVANGSNLNEAFRSAVENARWEYGNGGYTGSLAEKSDVIAITSTPMSEQAAAELAHSLIDSSDPRIDDKWGPAGAIPIDTNLTSRVEKVTVVVSAAEVEAAKTGQKSFSDALRDAAKAKLPKRVARQGERVLSVSARVTSVSVRKPRAVAAEGKPVTRYVVSGPGSAHPNWKTGFATQAQARAYALELAGTPLTRIPFGSIADEAWEVAAVSRRDTGAALVRVERVVDKYTVEATAVLEKSAPANAKASAWLLFGWASS